MEQLESALRPFSSSRRPTLSVSRRPRCVALLALRFVGYPSVTAERSAPKPDQQTHAGAPRKIGDSLMPVCWIIAGPNGAGKTTFALDCARFSRRASCLSNAVSRQCQSARQGIRRLGGEPRCLRRPRPVLPAAAASERLDSARQGIVRLGHRPRCIRRPGPLPPAAAASEHRQSAWTGIRRIDCGWQYICRAWLVS
jgi:hypothetical protein